MIVARTVVLRIVSQVVSKEGKCGSQMPNVCLDDASWPLPALTAKSVLESFACLWFNDDDDREDRYCYWILTMWRSPTNITS
jgi:hypothetical protein